MPLSILLLILALIALLFWRLWPEPLARAFQLADRTSGRLRSRRSQVTDSDWHYLEGGHGEPLVLLHGFNADAHHFCRVARHLTAHFRILAPDLPGFGETRAGAAAGFGIEDQARAVLDWLDQIGVRTFYLGGNSMGGYISVAIARLAPERVRALWLLAPGGLHSAKLSAVLEEVAEERHNPLVIRDLSDFRRLIDYCFVHPPWIPGPLSRFLARRSAAHAVQAQRIFDAMRYDSTPLENFADEVRTPALITWGQADQVLHPQGAAVLERLMPEAQSLIVPAIGHLPMLEAPRTVAEAWVAFTESLARRDAPGA
jgi:triacylglycerol lipase